MTEVKVIVDDEGQDVEAVFEEHIEVGSEGEGGGLSEDQVKEIVNEETKNLPTDIDAKVEEDKISLTLILKNKDGEEISKKTIELPMQDLSEYVKDTDYATASKAGLIYSKDAYGISIESDGGAKIAFASEKEISEQSNNRKPIVPKTLSEAVKVGLTANTKTLTDDEMKSARDLIGAVGSTDYMGKENAGVAKVNQNNSGMKVTDGFLHLYPCSPVALTLRNQTGVNYNERSPVTVGNLNIAVIASLTDDKKIIMTDEEKAVACETLGATKLYKHTITIYERETLVEMNHIVVYTNKADEYTDFNIGNIVREWIFGVVPNGAGGTASLTSITANDGLQLVCEYVTSIGVQTLNYDLLDRSTIKDTVTAL